MVIHKKCYVLKFPKFREMFFYNGWIGRMNKIKKRTYFRILHHSSFLIALCHRILTLTDSCLVWHPSVHCTLYTLYTCIFCAHIYGGSNSGYIQKKAINTDDFLYIFTLQKKLFLTLIKPFKFYSIFRKIIPTF